MEMLKKPMKEKHMQTVNKLMMLSMNVSDMPKAKAFYADKLGLKVTTDYRQNDDNWWVALAFPEGGATITLSRATGFENIKPGTMTLYFETSDIVAAHKELSNKGVKVNEVKDDLFGTGSGVKFFNLMDPDGNQVILAQAHSQEHLFNDSSASTIKSTATCDTLHNCHATRKTN